MHGAAGTVRDMEHGTGSASRGAGDVRSSDMFLGVFCVREMMERAVVFLSSRRLRSAQPQHSSARVDAHAMHGVGRCISTLMETIGEQWLLDLHRPNTKHGRLRSRTELLVLIHQDLRRVDQPGGLYLSNTHSGFLKSKPLKFRVVKTRVFTTRSFMPCHF